MIYGKFYERSINIMNKKALVILGVVLLLIVAFIWGNSVLSPELSDKISRFAGDILSGIVGVGDEVSTVGGIPVRKVGHFCEFFALGAAAWMLLKLLGLKLYVRIISVSLFGVVVPLLDETIQIFSGRGHSIKDVWIDIMGFAVGAAGALLVNLIISKIVNKSKNKH